MKDVELLSVDHIINFYVVYVVWSFSAIELWIFASK